MTYSRSIHNGQGTHGGMKRNLTTQDNFDKMQFFWATHFPQINDMSSTNQ